MKVLAVNSSPRTDSQSKTTLVLSHLISGMQSAGADVETVYLRKKTINPCTGCFSCWTRSPGNCIHKDDMAAELYDKWRTADLVVYATPLYHYTVTALMKAFIERTLPASEPFFLETDGVFHHPRRHPHPSAVVLSVAGFPHKSVFDQLSSYVRFLFKDTLKAELYCPAAEMLHQYGFREASQKVLAAYEKAGTQLVKNGAVTPDTLAICSQSVCDFDTFKTLGNMFWRTAIEARVDPKQFTKKRLVPRPESTEEYMLLSRMGFNPMAAEDLNATIQFIFTDDDHDNCYFKIAGQTLQTEPGTSPGADLTITTPFDVWIDIMTKKADGQALFMENAYTVDGDINLLLSYPKFFTPPKKE